MIGNWLLENPRDKELELKKRLKDENQKLLERSAEWTGMLYAKSKITILEGYSSEELTQQWDEFYNTINTLEGRLGSLCSIDDKQYSVNNDKHYIMVHYKQFTLKEEFTIEEYNRKIAEYELSKRYLKELEWKIEEQSELYQVFDKKRRRLLLVVSAFSFLVAIFLLGDDGMKVPLILSLVTGFLSLLLACVDLNVYD